MNNLIENMDYAFEEDAEQLEQKEKSDKYFFGRSDKIETDEIIAERLHELGVENIDLAGVKKNWQKQIADSVESMYENNPEIQGCIGSIRTAYLPKGVFACAGPKMTEQGLTSEIQLNKEMFSKFNLEIKIVDLERENFKGEKWLAGRGLDGVLKHEMGHVMHLKMIADAENIKFGDSSKEAYELLSKKFYRNSRVVTICHDSLKELEISPCDIGKYLSTYGASDSGEFFAEAISECETAKKPRALALKVQEKYKEFIKNQEGAA